MNSDLVSGQSYDGVWHNTILCANCHRAISEHCKVHLVPCCPQKCPGEVPA